MRVFKNFIIFLKNKITNVKFLLTIMFASLIILELGKFFNINLDYFYYFSLTPAVWLVYIAYDKYIAPIIARIFTKLFNLNEYHNYIVSIIIIFTRLFILYNGGLGYYICTYFLYFIDTYNISLIPIFNNINKNIFEIIYNSKIFNSVNYINKFNNINYNIIEIIHKLFNIINNNIINMFNNINNNIIKTIHNLNLFIIENNNIINILNNINKNIFETIYKIININIFNNLFNNINSFSLIIDKNTIINIINELFKNKLYLNGFDNYVYCNDLKIKIAMYHTGTPEGVETSKSNPDNGSRNANVGSNQDSQSVAPRISNRRHLPLAPYINENLIKWGINDLKFAKSKFGYIIAPFMQPYTNVPMEILHGNMYNINSPSVLVYLNKNLSMCRIEIDESKIFSLYIKEIDKYYDPFNSIWWHGYTGRWVDSDLYYLRGDIKVDQNVYKIKNSNKYTTLFINKSIKNLSFDENLNNSLKLINEWNIVHLNAYEYIKSNSNSYNINSIEARTANMLKLDNLSLNNYSKRLWAHDRPIRYFDSIVTKLLLEQSKLRVGTAERENISILIEQILALKCQTLVLNKNLSSNFLLLEKEKNYGWVWSSKFYMLENEERLNSIIKKPSDEIKMLKYVKPDDRNTG